MTILPVDSATYRQPTVRALLAVNFIPLIGVLFFGWNMFTLISIYWLETAVIGLFTLIRIGLMAKITALFLVPFFMVHMGGFMAGHWVFLSLFFGPKELGNNPMRCLSYALSQPEVWMMLLLLIASHGVSFYYNFFIKPRPDFTIKSAKQKENAKYFQGIIFEPYGRIIVMHITIIFGAMLTMMLGSNRWMFALLVVMKTAADLKGHLVLHKVSESDKKTPAIESVDETI